MKYFDEIERRLQGEMTIEEAQLFDREVLKNEELAQELELYQLEEDLLELAIEKDVLEEIKGINADQSSNKTNTGMIKKLYWRRGLSLVASITFLIIAYQVLVPYLNKRPPEELAQKYYARFPPNLSGNKTVKGSQDSFGASKSLLASDDHRRIRQAISFFERQKSSNAEAAYLLGHAFWYLGEYEKSVLNFEYFLDTSDQGDTQYPLAEFYKSLSLLGAQKVEETRRFIHQNKTGHPFEKQWEAILKQL